MISSRWSTLPDYNDAYMRWLLWSVLIECRTTLWCAREIGVKSDGVLRDFNRAVGHDASTN